MESENQYLKKRLGIAQNIANELKKLENIKMVALSGSCAIGCPNEKSDIDLQVAFEKMPDNAEVENIRISLIQKFSPHKQKKHINIGTIIGLDIDDIIISLFYGTVEDYKGVASATIEDKNEVSLTLYYDMIPLYDILDICNYIQNNMQYTEERRKSVLSEKIEKLQKLFDYHSLKIIGNNIMLLKYKYQIVENIIDIIYALNNRPRRMVNDFIYMTDKLNFCPQYISNELSSISIENNIDIINKQARELIIKLFRDSFDEILKESSSRFML